MHHKQAVKPNKGAVTLVPVQPQIENTPIKDSLVISVKAPEENRFTKTTLSDDLNEPMELAVAPNGDVFFIERAGKFYRYNSQTHKTTLVYNFPVVGLKELDGLLGFTIDPDFSHNGFMYFYHTAAEGKQHLQYLSRLTFKDNVLDLQSEKILLKVPVDINGRTHTGGSMAWDKDNNLYLSTGDNTFPGASNGFNPVDERPGRSAFDAQRSAANTNDLRGKILRIHPELNGTYTVPSGNLFAPGTIKTRPEIYVMGCRNPYRISVDPATSFLYWGEVGPDAFFDGKRGTHGFDEINQAKKAGNYGWPYFVGNNQAYADYDFATGVIGKLFDPEKPVNNSPNNTGLTVLPPAQKAMIWYSYSKEPRFPIMESGGRTAMAGPVYHYNSALKSNIKLPEYYDNKLFTDDWMRNLVLCITLNQDYSYKSMERFMPNANFIKPIDMDFGTDGALYMLEYGTVYGADNPDARLVRIEYNSGNRAPIAKIIATDSIGHTPLKISFSGEKSYDYDNGDKLSYSWSFGEDNSTSTASNPVYTYKKNGIYKVILKVTDQGNKSSKDTLKVKVGNTPPNVAIHIAGNSTFFFPGVNSLKYKVLVTDKEDAVINKKKIKTTLNYLPDAESSQQLAQIVNPGTFSAGKALIASNDCKACHQENKKIIGPAFMEVSKRYQKDKDAVDKLANKIIIGGNGVWTKDAVMNAHPQLAKEDAVKIVKYVLSLSKKQVVPRVLPQQGVVVLNKHIANPTVGRYILSASYTDQGEAITPFTTISNVILRPSSFKAENVDQLYNIKKGDEFFKPGNGDLHDIFDQSYFVLKDIDLKGINKLVYTYSSLDQDGNIELRIDNAKGTLINTVHFNSTGDWKKFAAINAAITPASGKHDLYFIFNGTSPKKDLCRLKSLQFKLGK